MQFVGIDVGRDHVKAVSAGREVSFVSRVGEWRERKLTSGGDYEAEIGGKRYFVADLAEESYFRREMATKSKLHQETQILFLAALALVASGERLVITTGLPVDQHTAQGKTALADLLTGAKAIRLNGRFYNFSIDRLGIVPEAGGAYWDAVLGHNGQVVNNWLCAQRVRVVDVGSRTINYCTIDQRKYLDRDSGTLDYGALELANAGAGEDAKEQFSRRIVADLSKRWLGYERDVVLFAGGGALLLERWLKPQFPLAQVAENPVFANARGFYKMGLARWHGN